FERGFARRLAAAGVAVEPEGLIRRMQAGMAPDDMMIDALATLRATGVPVALVTNALGRDCYDGFDLDALADAVVISSAVGVRKALAAHLRDRLRAPRGRPRGLRADRRPRAQPGR